jgi:hypothetical protein
VSPVRRGERPPLYIVDGNTGSREPGPTSRLPFVTFDELLEEDLRPRDHVEFHTASRFYGAPGVVSPPPQADWEWSLERSRHRRALAAHRRREARRRNTVRAIEIAVAVAIVVALLWMAVGGSAWPH